MAEHDVKIRVGAAVDANLATVLTPFLNAARRAREQVARDGAASGAALGSGVKSGAAAAEKAFAKLADEIRGKSASMLTPGTKAVVEFGKASKTSFDAARKSFADLARDAERQMRAMERDRARQTAYNQKYGGPFGNLFEPGQNRMAPMRIDAVSTAASLGRGAARFATRMGADLLKGIGVNTDVASMFSGGVSLERKAVELSNASFIAGKSGPTGQRQDPAAIIKDVRAVANMAAYDAGDALEGLQKFVGKTGDLETGRRILADMAVLSRATGTSLDDMVDAAGDVSNNLGDVPDKAAAIKAVMIQATAAGKEGAVEIKDLASQMAKLASAAPAFAGDRGHNMSLMVALAQEARGKGGAASSRMATTAVTSFVSQFSKQARVKEMEAAGLDIWETQGGRKTGRINDPQQILIAALQKTGGDPMKLGKMFMDQQAQRAVRGFANTYNDAYNATRGTDQEKMAAATKAVNEEFGKLVNATMSEQEIRESFSRAMGTTESQVTVFNNKMGETADNLRAQLLPALKELAPKAVAAAGALSDLILTLTGAKPKADSEAGVKYTNEAVNDAAVLRNRMDVLRGQAKEKGVTVESLLTPEDKAAIGRMQTAETEAQAKRAALQKHRAGMAGDELGGKPGQTTGEWLLGSFGGPLGIAASALGGASRRASGEAVQSDTRKIEGMDQTIEAIQRANAKVESALGKTLRVEVTNLPADMKGIAPPNAATGR